MSSLENVLNNSNGYNNKSYGIVAYMSSDNILKKSNLYYSIYNMLKDVVEDKSYTCGVVHPEYVRIELIKYKPKLTIEGPCKHILNLKDYIENEMLNFRKNKFMILPDEYIVVNEIKEKNNE